MLKDTVLPAVASLSALSGALKVRLEQFGSGILIALAALLVLSGQLVVIAVVVLRAVAVHQVLVGYHPCASERRGHHHHVA